MNYYDKKNQGALKFKNKKFNNGNIGCGRSDINRQSCRGKVKQYDRWSHHSRRRILNNGIKNGAQEMWMHSTTCEQKRKSGWHAFSGFNKFRYRN